MFCSKCGKEIMDEAVICPNCGCPTNNYQQSTAPAIHPSGHSEYYPQVQRFAEQVKTVYILSIVSIVLCMGIGIIFAIIGLIQANNIIVPHLTLTYPLEIAEFEGAKRKLSTARKLCRLSIGICLITLGLSLFIGMFVGIFSIM